MIPRSDAWDISCSVSCGFDSNVLSDSSFLETYYAGCSSSPANYATLAISLFDSI